MNGLINIIGCFPLVCIKYVFKIKYIEKYINFLYLNDLIFSEKSNRITAAANYLIFFLQHASQLKTE